MFGYVSWIKLNFFLSTQITKWKILLSFYLIFLIISDFLMSFFRIFFSELKDLIICSN